MIFVPKERAQASIKRLHEKINKREAEKSAEWRKNYVRRINVD